MDAAAKAGGGGTAPGGERKEEGRAREWKDLWHAAKLLGRSLGVAARRVVARTQDERDEVVYETRILEIEIDRARRDEGPGMQAHTPRGDGTMETRQAAQDAPGPGRADEARGEGEEAEAGGGRQAIGPLDAALGDVPPELASSYVRSMARLYHKARGCGIGDPDAAQAVVRKAAGLVPDLATAATLAQPPVPDTGQDAEAWLRSEQSRQETARRAAEAPKAAGADGVERAADPWAEKCRRAQVVIAEVVGSLQAPKAMGQDGVEGLLQAAVEADRYRGRMERGVRPGADPARALAVAQRVAWLSSRPPGAQGQEAQRKAPRRGAMER